MSGSIGCIPVSAEESCAWENKIAALDPLKQNDQIALNRSLVAGSILDYCKVKEKLLLLTYEELQGLIASTNKNPSLKTLHNLLKFSLPTPKDIYFLVEDIFINNKPLLEDSPFYSKTLSGASITGMKRHAEQIYVNNLKLTYQKNVFVKEEDGLWVGDLALESKPAFNSRLKQDQQEMFYWERGQKNPLVSLNWSWQLQDDYRHDFFHSVRQYMKHYEGPLEQPVIYKNTVIAQNAYRFFCRDLSSGKELWSLGPDNGGEEFYHIFRHPHQNSHGYGFILSGDILFSQLGGKLAAVDVADICRPYLKWTRELGEYTLCTKPALAGNNLVCGLVNARGEVWFCGFDIQKGMLLWSRYIGTSSFLAPVCTLAAVTGDQIVIATNHGFLVCLAPDNGQIIWLKKYAPHRYNEGDYWWEGYYKDVFLDTGSIPFDTQFLQQADNGLIYYKPRESDYFYTIKPNNGETVQKIYVDPAFLYILGVYGDKAVFLQKGDFPSQNRRLIVADLRTGKQLFATALPDGKLKGILYPKASQILFKVDKNLFILDLADPVISLNRISLRQSDWLLAVAPQSVLVGENRNMKCLNLGSRAGLKDFPLGDPVSVYFDSQERVKKEFSELNKAELQPNLLLEEIKKAGFSVNDIFLIIQKNLNFLRDPAWRGFVEEVNNIYGKGVITYRDVQMTLNNFIAGSGLQPKAVYQKPVGSKPKINLKAMQKGYRANTGNTLLLGVKVIRGADPADFFIILNSGQIVCVGENGDIRWERKIFFGSIWQSDMEEDKDWHLYSDDIEIYLYDDTLIVNDRVNVIAMDVNTGAYLWSMTNKQDVLNNESQLPTFTSIWSYESRFYFAQQIMMRVEFLDDTLIVSHGGMLYALDPKTGYCKTSCPAPVSCVMDMKTAEGKLYVASHAPNAQIKVFDKNLKASGDFSSSSVGESRTAWPQLVFLPNYVLLHIRPSLHIFDRISGRFLHTFNIEDVGRHYIEPYQDGFILIAPFLKTCGYSIKDGIPQQRWEYALQPQDQRVVWDLTCLRSFYYFMAGDRVLNFVRKQDDYWLVALDLASGRKVWETKLEGMQGRFFNLSSSIQLQGRLRFITTCVYMNGEKYTEDLDIIPKLIPGTGLYAADLDSVFFSLDPVSGRLWQAQRLPSCRLIGFLREDVFQTQNFFQYNLYRTSIRCLNKKDQ
ncbi:MAG TPA: PQQ-binding-like beta-propeller repeat protein [Candidatus Omnitrophota bacterium]|nr:PQQ-binding-like beta-propeller repeat protein [Candidatus Omnitrophota bacterium]HPT39554.1 PQQ-binding-like beta-propeller repeat protein [Candidatus Omnitrophota bacterium]